jgi:hypothetical protein
MRHDIGKVRPTSFVAKRLLGRLEPKLKQLVSRFIVLGYALELAHPQ